MPSAKRELSHLPPLKLVSVANGSQITQFVDDRGTSLAHRRDLTKPIGRHQAQRKEEIQERPSLSFHMGAGAAEHGTRKAK